MDFKTEDTGRVVSKGEGVKRYLYDSSDSMDQIPFRDPSPGTCPVL